MVDSHLENIQSYLIIFSIFFLKFLNAAHKRTIFNYFQKQNYLRGFKITCFILTKDIMHLFVNK